MALRSQIFVDKSRLDRKNKPLCADTSEIYVCKQTKKIWKIYGCGMLAAYYDRSVNTKELFQSLKIKSTKDYEKHLNNMMF